MAENSIEFLSVQTPYSQGVLRSVGTLSLENLSQYRYQSYGLINGFILISTQILLLKEQILLL